MSETSKERIGNEDYAEDTDLYPVSSTLGRSYWCFNPCDIDRVICILAPMVFYRHHGGFTGHSLAPDIPQPIRADPPCK